MSLLATPKNPNSSIEVVRQLADYHPTVWGEHFLINDQLISSLTSVDEKEEKQVGKLKVEINNNLMGADGSTETLEKLDFIDKIQRLGISYHFEKEIEQVLETVYKDYLKSCRGGVPYFHDNLHNTALVFRLLRQQGFNISCDVFNKFKDSERKFDETLKADARGLLSLYEASYMSMHGEDILEEALDFTIFNLKSLIEEDKLDSSVAAQVKQALQHSLRRGLPRLHAWHYINNYNHTDQDSSHSQLLLSLAKLDFNLLQKQHQRELHYITKWWKDLEVEKNFPFARDRLAECYFWILGVYFEPEYLIGRNILTRVISMTSIMDDIYDAYGTIDELELLTNAIDKWDTEVIDELPKKYLQIYYKALLDLYDEFEELLEKQGTSFRFFYAKEAMKAQAKFYFKEAQWYNQNYTPTLEEYMSLATESTSYGLLATTSLVGMGDAASKQAFDWLLTNPKILRASKNVCRLMDDIVSNEFEQKRGHVTNAVECHIRDYGVTEEEAKKMMWVKIDNGWKDINEELIIPTQVPSPILTRILNFTRVIEVLYKYKDYYTHSTVEFKAYIDSLLNNPIPI